MIHTMRTSRTAPAALASLLLILTLLAGTAGAHAERETEFPDGTGTVPNYRPLGKWDERPHRIVCTKRSESLIKSKIDDASLRRLNLRMLEECDYRLIQDAVDSVNRKRTTVYVLPGTYRERPNRDVPKCAKEGTDNDGGTEGAPILSYKEQRLCPHAQNLIGIFGDKDFDNKRECNAPQCFLQLEGTGDDPGDVTITGGFDKKGEFAKLNGIRADRADGAYFKNFTIQLFEFNALYVLETDGFVIDDVVGRWNDEYGFLTFAVDHGLYKNCEGYGNGDSAIYPGSASDVNNENEETGELTRWAVEVRNCKSHHNALGYSGTAGNSVYVHDNEFFANGTGITTDSVFPNHPGLPQDHGWFTDNEIHGNNVNYYEQYVQGEDAVCDRPPAERGYRKGVVCPVIPAPVGTGILIAGGNHNFVQSNQFYDNWRNGVMLVAVPAVIRGEPEKGYDTSHHNHYVDNLFGLTADGTADPNGLDVWWDDGGEGNCWQDNQSSNEAPSSNAQYPGGLPDCDGGGSALPAGQNPEKAAFLVPCSEYDREDNKQPPGCDWFTTPEEPE
ncbi:MAG: right-handed parallel beta-helix repeat-containing protein [Actinomycetota bacterium]